MLRSLTIRDFVIVDELELEFGSGLTVFSGETGAGKSILIDALALALGERGDASVVREGAVRADIAAEFTTEDAAEAWLAANELGNDGSALLRRVIDAAGRSKAWINGAPATLAQLRELGDLLVDIHGQHAHQLLLRAGAQRNLLDAQAGLESDARAVGDAYRTWRAVAAQMKALATDARALQLEREQLDWQVKELTQLAIKPGEWEASVDEHQRLAHAATLIEGARTSVESLTEADDAIVAQLAAIIHKLEPLARIDAALKPVLDALEPARIEIDEAARSLNDYLSRIELDPARLAAVEARIEAMHTAARKFRVAPENLSAELERLSARLASLEGATDLDALAAREKAASAAYRKQAEALSQARAQTAPALAAAITEGMQTLSMAGGKFEIALLPIEPSGNGLEEIEFRVAAHSGATPRALAKVASGGELARISLAISVIASAATTVPTLIFDEVDSGIGGAVAEVVGRLLRRLGSDRQVLCVTHLPQVAALGQAHFAVRKETSDERALARVERLDAPARVDEVARMLGGIAITPTTRKHARELIALAG